MRSGIHRGYLTITTLAFAAFTMGAVFQNDTMLVFSFLLLAIGIFMFYGRKVRMENGRIILEWGFFLKRRKVIEPGDIIEVVDAPSNRYLVFARYMPEVLLLPAVMVLFGFLAFFVTDFRWVGLGWILFGGIQLVSYTYSEAERRKGAALILSLTLLVALVGYFVKVEVVAPIVVSGMLLAGLFWEDGPIFTNMIFIVTREGVYTITYTSRNDIKALLAALGGEGWRLKERE
ncbi:hypothetical protein E3E26_04215 [Thermococcus sp. LS1]|uniref:hypothetical protein n=1 Tax=Thermococcus sp. LS1 TaxID=1638259 RepID=UPI00143B1497|nr:hypothetical protein [Thermococcus sp. LS1]NJD98991.1 hypothetical protein [Thermococcus sp. LS1]